MNFNSSRLILELEFHEGELMYNERVKRQCVKQRERQKVSLSMIRLGTKPSLPLVLGSLAKGTGKMHNDLLVTVREKIGPIATPDYIQNAPGLPKTRSGMFRGL